MSYPIFRTASSSNSGSTASFTRTVAERLARFTDAASTPGWRERTRSIRLAHEAQVMPSTAKSSTAVASGCVSGVVGDVVAHLLDRTHDLFQTDLGLVELEAHGLGLDLHFDRSHSGKAR